MGNHIQQTLYWLYFIVTISTPKLQIVITFWVEINFFESLLIFVTTGKTLNRLYRDCNAIVKFKQG